VSSDYVLLREHFKTAHVLCEEGECRHAEFTNAFRSDLDYRAHWAQKHSAGVGRQQARQMRQIDISVDFGSSDNAVAAGDARSQRGGRQRGLLCVCGNTGKLVMVARGRITASVYVELSYFSGIASMQKVKVAHTRLPSVGFWS